jgi:hypothetical protein
MAQIATNFQGCLRSPLMRAHRAGLWINLVIAAAFLCLAPQAAITSDKGLASVRTGNPRTGFPESRNFKK